MKVHSTNKQYNSSEHLHYSTERYIAEQPVQDEEATYKLHLLRQMKVPT